MHSDNKASTFSPVLSVASLSYKAWQYESTLNSRNKYFACYTTFLVETRENKTCYFTLRYHIRWHSTDKCSLCTGFRNKFKNTHFEGTAHSLQSMCTAGTLTNPHKPTSALTKRKLKSLTLIRTVYSRTGVSQRVIQQRRQLLRSNNVGQTAVYW
jgi:hypothetical protein